MKQKFPVLVSILAIITALPLAHAIDVEKHLGLGVNFDTYQSDLPANYDLERNHAFAPALGFKAMSFWGNVGFRSGVFLEYKRAELENETAPAGQRDIDLTAYYAAIPLNLQFNLHDNWAIYGGIMPRFLMAKTCDNCGGFDDRSNFMVNYGNAGVTYNMNERFSVDVGFQHALNDNFDDLKINTAQVMFFYKM
jgi:hypothetical protein